MKAAVIRGPANIGVETVDIPTIRDNEILVKVKASGICGSDRHFFMAGPTAIPKGRTIIGHEFSGEVMGGRLRYSRGWIGKLRYRDRYSKA